MDVRKLIPKDKSDFDSVNKLKECNKDTLRPIIPDLLIWLQDINWPIASEISNILIQFDEELIPHIMTILNSDDTIWKYWILTKIVSRITLGARAELRQDLIKLSNHPKPDEVAEGMDELAQELLIGLAL